MVRKGKENDCGEGNMAGNYTVVVDGKQYSVQVVEGSGDVQITPAANTPGNVWKILKNPGDKVEEGDVIMILEAMKMEIDIAAPQAGTIKTINVNVNDAVADGQLLATME